ncbi:recombinase family protein [Bradyrhizobium sp. CCBAU 53380]|uniref:recombinase family protein n=1 Tax=Bradyrhizobium sp. CCBAU 53380 TaxID=1325117 RepID=UPI0023025C41|nr:recombinase family protein [Bradyrhizobium sp. CCBAU 53380]MDA9423098.1 serine recombinase [Bradyrhizobium sp. CCBAU 53380]
MRNALVVRTDRLPQSQKAHRAAQYVRMSTDYQQYSIENQAVVIAAYAELHKLTIVRTYRDDGESGLKIENRGALTELMDDVLSGRNEFDHLLVFDVSRWGRFQDVDESAHYEFICRKAGIKVAYCAEQFDNDGSLLSSILKNIKRVMAAEFSRELSAKVYAGECRLARLGFKMGGRPSYGLRRVVIDERGKPKGTLSAGERKYLITDRVTIGPGALDEIEVVKWIYAEFLAGKSQSAIKRELNRRGVPTNTGRPWSVHVVGGILQNEAYIGNFIWNQSSQKLGAHRTRNPREHWIRSEARFEPIIDRADFLQARKIIEGYRVCISDTEMLTRLRKVLMKKGVLSGPIINAAPSLPCCTTYLTRFGSLRNLYRLVGYDYPKHWNDLNDFRRWSDLSVGFAAALRERFEQVGRRAVLDSSIGCLDIDDGASICFGIARWRKYEGHGPRWMLRRRSRWPAGWIVAIRLNANNDAIQDYILLPSLTGTRMHLWISDTNLQTHNIEVFQTYDKLVRSLVPRVTEKCAAFQSGGD